VGFELGFFKFKILQFQFYHILWVSVKNQVLVPWTHYKFPYARDCMGTNFYNILK